MTQEPDSRAAWVIARVAAIPEGFVATYGDIDPRAPRFVGRVLATHPLGSSDALPWHRVVRADGIPPMGDRQLRRLRAEGVPLRGGRVDLGRARYHGW